MNIHIYNLFYICTGTHACMGFVPDNKLIRIRIRIRIDPDFLTLFEYNMFCYSAVRAYLFQGSYVPVVTLCVPAVVSTLHAFVLNQLPSRNPRTQRRLTCDIHLELCWCITWM